MVLIYEWARLSIGTCLIYIYITLIAGNSTFTLVYSFFCSAFLNASFWCVGREGFQLFARAVGGVWFFQILKL